MPKSLGSSKEKLWKFRDWKFKLTKIIENPGIFRFFGIRKPTSLKNRGFLACEPISIFFDFLERSMSEPILDFGFGYDRRRRKCSTSPKTDPTKNYLFYWTKIPKFSDFLESENHHLWRTEDFWHGNRFQYFLIFWKDLCLNRYWIVGFAMIGEEESALRVQKLTPLNWFLVQKRFLGIFLFFYQILWFIFTGKKAG